MRVLDTATRQRYDNPIVDSGSKTQVLILPCLRISADERRPPVPLPLSAHVTHWQWPARRHGWAVHSLARPLSKLHSPSNNDCFKV